MALCRKYSCWPIYHVSVDMEIPYNVYGGMQDNGHGKVPLMCGEMVELEMPIGMNYSLGMASDVMMDPSDSTLSLCDVATR